MTKTILVVDDEKRLRRLLQDYLTQEGFRVVTAGDGQEALFVARYEKPDIIVLDLMMPGMGGYEFLRAYRKERDTPVIILTAKLEEGDKVLGLELGADDYVTKPFGMRELTARVRAVLRRTGSPPTEPERLRVAGVTLDLDGHIARVGDELIDLTPSEFDLLAALMSAPGRVFSRLDLLERLQGIALESSERSIDVHIRNLRAKIEPDPRSPRYIESIYGFGYRFAVDRE
ncbi:MAG: response regulator transcription factor [Thermoflexales bacterium]|nr:response regulator transcription factor [Thermoflexales bacterium]